MQNKPVCGCCCFLLQPQPSNAGSSDNSFQPSFPPASSLPKRQLDCCDQRMFCAWSIGTGLQFQHLGAQIRRIMCVMLSWDIQQCLGQPGLYNQEILPGQMKAELQRGCTKKTGRREGGRQEEEREEKCRLCSRVTCDPMSPTETHQWSLRQV